MNIFRHSVEHQNHRICPIGLVDGSLKVFRIIAADGADPFSKILFLSFVYDLWFESHSLRHFYTQISRKGAIWCHLGAKKVPFDAIFGVLNLLLDEC